MSTGILLYSSRFRKLVRETVRRNDLSELWEVYTRFGARTNFDSTWPLSRPRHFLAHGSVGGCSVRSPSMTMLHVHMHSTHHHGAEVCIECLALGQETGMKHVLLVNVLSRCR